MSSFSDRRQIPDSPSKKRKLDSMSDQLFAAVTNFRFFNENKIDPSLRDVEQFRQALFMVEDLLDNDRLCSYFSYMIQVELREENFFDLTKALEYIDQTRHSLKQLCSRVSFTVEDLPDDYSRFRGVRGVSSEYDLILFNSEMINGLRGNQQQSHPRFLIEIFFVFVKLLHELSHGCIMVSGRQMSQRNPKRFYTPMTHCLQGEAGWAMERMLFGSKIDACGHIVDGKFIIEYLTLTDGTPSGVIDRDWINLFVKDSLYEKKLKVVQKLERIPYVHLTEALRTKLEDGKTIVKKVGRHSKSFFWDELD